MPAMTKSESITQPLTIFMHIEKTGGSSFRELLRVHFAHDCLDLTTVPAGAVLDNATPLATGWRLKDGLTNQARSYPYVHVGHLPFWHPSAVRSALHVLHVHS